MTISFQAPRPWLITLWTQNRIQTIVPQGHQVYQIWYISFSSFSVIVQKYISCRKTYTYTDRRTDRQRERERERERERDRQTDRQTDRVTGSIALLTPLTWRGPASSLAVWVTEFPPAQARPERHVFSSGESRCCRSVSTLSYSTTACRR